MAMVSISEAAKLAGISRSYFHRKYVKQGIVSVSTTPKGKKQIDTSELLRVFGQLQGSHAQSSSSQGVGAQSAAKVHGSSHLANGGSQGHDSQFTPPVNNAPNGSHPGRAQPDNHLLYDAASRAKEAALVSENELLKRQLRETYENAQRLRDEFLDREKWYRQQIGKQDDKVKLLEHQYIEQLVRPKWWQFWR